MRFAQQITQQTVQHRIISQPCQQQRVVKTSPLSGRPCAFHSSVSAYLLRAQNPAAVYPPRDLRPRCRSFSRARPVASAGPPWLPDYCLFQDYAQGLDQMAGAQSTQQVELNPLDLRLIQHLGRHARGRRHVQRRHIHLENNRVCSPAPFNGKTRCARAACGSTATRATSVAAVDNDRLAKNGGALHLHIVASLANQL
jgi:hypothetical protein